ncbi:MAG: Gfo/Idh/MocA family oxidoreductase [Microbacteriaceae bacterium]|nr:Gfo/Idh/MocA family oxidoreductase [Microbacteriaceae bacterium]MCL2793705.1 Gfo/Idh/MocA family oxidoreductase [Microbacteriaceae bacterium]
MSATGITVAVVGLGFGQDFVPLYLRHPQVAGVVLVEPDEERRREAAARFGLDAGYSGLDDALGDPKVDAVHILAPVFLHADMVVAALEAGKHVACAVPMATTLDDIDRIIAAAERSGLTYMMMETAVFAREYFAVRDMHSAGELGALTLYRGFHVQNLDGYPPYWQGFPPMHYVTHALAPILALLGTSVLSVSCRGAGRLTAERRAGGFENPFPAEVGLFALRDSDVVADVTMSFFQTARSAIEGFSLYGERRGVEWAPAYGGPLTVYDMSGPERGERGNRVDVAQLHPAGRTETLPESLRPFVQPTRARFSATGDPVRVEAYHGGSHPHLVHEFVSAVIERRPSVIGPREAATWTAPGICAHLSALRGGAAVPVPQYLAVREPDPLCGNRSRLPHSGSGSRGRTP